MEDYEIEVVYEVRETYHVRADSAEDAEMTATLLHREAIMDSIEESAPSMEDFDLLVLGVS